MIDIHRRYPDLPLFDGPGVEPADEVRLVGLLGRVGKRMALGDWCTLAELASWCRGSEASVSARLRDLRKTRFGGHTIERRRTSTPGVWAYRMVR